MRPTAAWNREPFGPYVVEVLLGSGGLGMVFRALDTRNKKKVAIKIPKEPTKKRRVIDGFLTAGVKAAELEHPCIARILEVDMVEGDPCIAMEYVDGNPMTAYCGEVYVPLEMKIRWMLDTARALAKAHGRGILHEGFKPANVMIAVDEGVKVVDFGLPRRRKAQSEVREALLIGDEADVGWIAPELGRGKPASERSDQFAWGKAAYDLVEGYDAIPPSRRVLANEPLPRLDDRHADVPTAVADVITRALEHDPARRWSDMHDVVSALEMAYGDYVYTLPPGRPPPPRLTRTPSEEEKLRAAAADVRHTIRSGPA